MTQFKQDFQEKRQIILELILRNSKLVHTDRVKSVFWNQVTAC